MCCPGPRTSRASQTSQPNDHSVRIAGRGRGPVVNVTSMARHSNLYYKRGLPFVVLKKLRGKCVQKAVSAGSASVAVRRDVELSHFRLEGIRMLLISCGYRSYSYPLPWYALRPSCASQIVLSASSGSAQVALSIEEDARGREMCIFWCKIEFWDWGLTYQQ